MGKICKSGYKISNADQKILNYYSINPFEWMDHKLKEMIELSISTIIRDWFERYRKLDNKIIPKKLGTIIYGILEMKKFKKYNIPSFATWTPQRKQPVTIEICPEGFKIKNHEYKSLFAFYKDPEKTLIDYMENEIAILKKKFVKENEEKSLENSNKEKAPMKYDDLIDMIIKC